MQNFLLNLNYINPVVRKVGIQVDEWHKKRKIYDYEIMFCVSGHAKIYIEDQEIDLVENTLVMIMPNQAHTFKMINQSSLIYWVHFDFFQFLDVSELDRYVSANKEELYLDNLIKTNYIRPIIPQLENASSIATFSKEESVRIARYLSRIKILYDSEGPLWQMEAKGFLMLILVQYLNRINITETSQDQVTGEFVYSVVSSYILQNMHKKLTVEEVTKNIPYCHDYAGKLFKRASGLTIVEYINKVKLESAESMLAEGQLSINDIASGLGFTSQHYFSRFIKKQTGMTPSQLKKSLLS